MQQYPSYFIAIICTLLDPALPAYEHTLTQPPSRRRRVPCFHSSSPAPNSSSKYIHTPTCASVSAGRAYSLRPGQDSMAGKSTLKKANLSCGQGLSCASYALCQPLDFETKLSRREMLIADVFGASGTCCLRRSKRCMRTLWRAMSCSWASGKRLISECVPRASLLPLLFSLTICALNLADRDGTINDLVNKRTLTSHTTSVLAHTLVRALDIGRQVAAIKGSRNAGTAIHRVL